MSWSMMDIFSQNCRLVWIDRVEVIPCQTQPFNVPRQRHLFLLGACLFKFGLVVRGWSFLQVDEVPFD